MTALGIDTHKFVRRLRDAGFEEGQAEAIVRVAAEIEPRAHGPHAGSSDPISHLAERIEALRTEIWKAVYMLFLWIAAFVILALAVAL